MTIWKRIRNGWMAFAHVLARIQTAILLSLVYHVTVGPIGLIGRVTGQDLLQQRPPTGSRWQALPGTTKTLEQARKQF